MQGPKYCAIINFLESSTSIGKCTMIFDHLLHNWCDEESQWRGIFLVTTKLMIITYNPIPLNWCIKHQKKKKLKS